MTSVQAELSSTRLCAEPNTLSYALNAQQRGWSVIPLLGGNHPIIGKRPRVAWTKYQTQRASEQQINTWFGEGCEAYGVICGSISNLIVIDFDEAEAQSEFILKYPHLMNTLIVQSGLRGTLHIYLQVDFPVGSCKLRGGDLKAEGSYIVGAGSQIADGVWKVVNDAPLYQISEAELSEVISTFGITQAKLADTSFLAEDAKSPDDFVRIYHFLVNELDSRNEALFRTGCYMRDEGYSASDVIAVLASIHAHQKPTHQHKTERYKQRIREAERTIQSVFTKPARPKRQRIKQHMDDASYLPNALRELILKESDGAAFLRVYEGLLLSGKSAGETVTEREILELLSPYGVGRPSVRKALKFELSPSLRNPPHAVADLAITASTTKTCVFVQTTTGDKTLGRPAQHYLIPDVSWLCKLVNIDNIASDPIMLEDIRTVGTYRAALNRELIKRRPGRYSQPWLGNRLNISSRTVQRYLKRENIQSRQLFEELRITWSNLNQIPTLEGARQAGMDMQPYFLQDEQGKRYPPKPEIAKLLLKHKHQVWLMKRSVKMYWYRSEPMPELQVQLQKKARSARLDAHKQQRFVLEPTTVPRPTVPVQTDIDFSEKVSLPTQIAHHIDGSQAKPEKRSRSFYKEPLSDKSDEWLAQKIYHATGNLPIVEARQLVYKYGQKAVGQALGRMEYLRAKGKIENPAGFMKVVSRVCWRTIHGFDVPKPEYNSPTKRRSRKRPANAKEDPLWQSEPYRKWRLSFEHAPIDVWEIPQMKKEIDF